MNLFILNFCKANVGWLAPKVFCELEQTEMDKEIASAKEKGYSVSTIFIPSSAAAALQNYFTSK